MEIVVMDCRSCGIIKDFWLINKNEDGFACVCKDKYSKFTKHFDSSFGDYFMGLITSPMRIEDIKIFCEREHLIISDNTLKNELKKYESLLLSYEDINNIFDIIYSNHDVHWFRKELVTYIDKIKMLQRISDVSPRIDIIGLYEYLNNVILPMSEEKVIKMEEAIEERLYNPKGMEIKKVNVMNLIKHHKLKQNESILKQKVPILGLEKKVSKKKLN